MSPSDYENTFIKAGDSETRERLRVEEVTGASQSGAAVSSIQRDLLRSPERSCGGGGALQEGDSGGEEFA